MIKTRFQFGYEAPFPREAKRGHKMIVRINAPSDPLGVSDFSGYGFANTLSLSRLLAPNARLQLTKERDAPTIFPLAGTLFLFGSSEAMRRRIEGEGRYRVEATGEPTLWRLVPK